MDRKKAEAGLWGGNRKTILRILYSLGAKYWDGAEGDRVGPLKCCQLCSGNQMFIRMETFLRYTGYKAKLLNNKIQIQPFIADTVY